MLNKELEYGMQVYSEKYGYLWYTGLRMWRPEGNPVYRFRDMYNKRIEIPSDEISELVIK